MRLQKADLITLTYKGHMVPEIARPNAASQWRLNFVVTETTSRNYRNVVRLIGKAPALPK
jgi:hypothetical protein